MAGSNTTEVLFISVNHSITLMGELLFVLLWFPCMKKNSKVEVCRNNELTELGISGNTNLSFPNLIQYPCSVNSLRPCGQIRYKRM